MPSRPAKRRQRQHGVLPAGFKWRDGRPRWDPSPTRRKQGWRGCDLKDGWGAWLTKGRAVERCQAICDAVAAWQAGLPLAPQFAAIAPANARPAPAAGGDPRSIGVLLDGYYDSDKFKRLKPRTQADYKVKIKRLLGVLAGGADEARIAAIRARLIDVLLPPAFGEAGDFELELAYEILFTEAGPHMAHGVMASASAWLGWCVKKKRVWPTNPAELVERAAPDGRIVVYTWPEIVALVRAAEALGHPSIGDAIVLGLDLSWGQQDLLALTWAQIAETNRHMHVKHRRIKTGVAGNPPLLAIGRDRIQQIRARWASSTVRHTHVLICELTNQPWNAHTFRHAFADVRAEAAKAAPSLADKQFRDLRDTAVTYGIDAGLTIEGICSRSLHAPARAQAIISKHYGQIGQAVTDGAAEKLDAHFKAAGYTFDQAAAPTQGGNR